MQIEEIHQILDPLAGNLPGDMVLKILPAQNQYTSDIVSISIQKEEKKIAVEFNKEPRLMHLPYFKARNFDCGSILVVANHISDPVKGELRKFNVNYIDAAGNIYINEAPILIYIDGMKRKPIKEKYKNRAFTKTGLRVVFAFLQEPELLNLPYRNIAEQLEVALDTVHNVINGLKETGYIISLTDKKNTLVNLKQLLERWVQEYDMRLKPDLFLGSFRFLGDTKMNDWQEMKLDAPELQWGGEPAGALITSYLRPGELTLYTSKKKIDVMKELKLVSDPKGDVKLYKKFWQDKDADKQYVPEMLVFTDLLNHGDSRNAETAQRIYEQHLQDRFS